MKLILTIFVFFAFTMGTSGLSKAVEAHNTIGIQTISISQITYSSQESLSKCCASEEEKSEKQSPRCIGDICSSLEILKLETLGLGKRLSILLPAYIGNVITTTFLRPPIA